VLLDVQRCVPSFSLTMSNDVSLDDELLQVTEKKSKVQKKAKGDKSPTRDEEGEVSGSNEDSDHKSGKRKPKADNKKPLKKRKTDDSSEDSSGDEAFNDGWDDDLMGDDADREKLMAMPEIEREDILSERYQKRKELRDGWEVKRRLKAEQRAREKKDKKDSGKESKPSREAKDREARDLRPVRKPDTKGKALSELKKKRAKAGYKRSDSDDEVEEGEVEEHKDDDDDYALPKGGSSDHDAGSTARGKQDEEEEEEIVYHDEDDEDQGHPVTWQDVEKLRLDRGRLEKWIDKPFFNSLIPGFFVRIGIGMDPQTRMNVYRVAQVDSVVLKSSYLMSGKQTTKWLKLLIGDKAKEFKMETISNRPFSETEYKHWKMQMERSVHKMPMSKEVQKKVETLETAEDYRYTSVDIEKMLEEKKKSGALPISVGAEKARLAIIRDTTANPEEKAELEKKIAQLDELAKERGQKRVSTTSVFNINQRNKQYNFDTAMKSKSEEKSGNNDLDPFSRRKTMPTIVYASKHKDEAEKPPETPVPVPTAATSNTPSTTTNNNNNTNGNGNGNALKTSIDGNLKSSAGAPPAKTSEHDSIDIDIPLEPSSSAPSRTFHSHPASNPTPTTPPFVPTENKKPKSTLSLDDYMRRRRAME